MAVASAVPASYSPAMPQSDEETLRLWREQCRRQLQRPMSARLRYGFVGASQRDRTNRSFATMREYRRWCEEHYPTYLGYGSAGTRAKV